MQIFKIKPLAVIAIAAALLLQGCGWHLRGAEPLPPELQTLYLQTASETSDFARALKRSLKASDVTLTNSSANAPYRLIVSGINRTTRTISTTGAAKVAEYALTSSVTFSVSSQEDEELVAPTRLSVEKSYLYNSSNAISSYEEEALLRKEMQRDLVQQLIRRYRGIKPTVADAEKSTETE